jgi:hypothetical protein
MRFRNLIFVPLAMCAPWGRRQSAPTHADVVDTVAAGPTILTDRFAPMRLDQIIGAPTFETLAADQLTAREERPAFTNNQVSVDWASHLSDVLDAAKEEHTVAKLVQDMLELVESIRQADSRGDQEHRTFYLLISQYIQTTFGSSH